MAHFFFGGGKPSKPKSDEASDLDDEKNDEIETPKQYAKEKAVKVKNDENEESETQMNTRLNAMMFHVSNDSVDSYKQENTSLDLLGRLYYDDYDSDSVSSASELPSPIASPSISTLDHLKVKSLSNTNINAAFRAQTSPLVSRSSSSSRLSNLNTRPQLPHLKSLERGISFDTSTHDHHKTYTCKLKHPQFKFRRNNKLFLVGFNNDQESLKAIEWLFDEMVINGDTLIILQVLDEKRFDHIDKSKAKKILNSIETLNSHKKKVAVVFETAIGKPQKLLKKAIEEYGPAMMVVGTHHYDDRNTRKSFLSKSSISKHFLECALVPVIVVKPSYQYVEILTNPIALESYFQDWLAEIDLYPTYNPNKKKKHKFLSPSSSRSGSSTNLPAQERQLNTLSPTNTLQGHKHSNSNSQVYSKNIKPPSSSHPDKPSEPEDRGRKSEKPASDSDEFDFTPYNKSRSTSRSNSRSNSSSRLSRFFGKLD
ncbi:hypothetical protein HYPBUDRAFT_109438 [Hyphopichia burtonii NRRL Y-1933]|uniref:UspA domain-containing protein n=1 Tax=Hyphopichia burtonii NRRL Y-1933 TaxID=984485 RepID=A0A1E4RHP8_9ASCO|nr:hypothetical protein HYPBUDRAFT_109438 [Hyphopichia burtonii NRRL Y-1933]ODV66789.1 hypothetical protein HYPBUDRAFT_109438 [Hyphopichia burtonii NRRL Y-1933]